MNDTQKPLRFIPPVRDFIFKGVFGDAANTSFLESLLQSTLDLPVDEYQKIEITDPNLQKEYEKDKLSILDLKLHTKSGQIINVEIQACDTEEIRERMVFTLAKTFASQLHSGEKYRGLKRVISIQITDFNLLEDDEEPAQYYHNTYLFKNNRSGKVFSNIMETHLLELPKAPKKHGASDDMLANWLRFIAAKTPEEVDMAGEASPIIKQAVGRYKVLSADEKMQLLEEQRIKDEWFRQDLINTAVNKGVKDNQSKILKFIENGGTIEQLKKMLKGETL
jgi:predicted transposase/invertase (TIGR01784 family)